LLGVVLPFEKVDACDSNIQYKIGLMEAQSVVIHVRVCFINSLVTYISLYYEYFFIFFLEYVNGNEANKKSKQFYLVIEKTQRYNRKHIPRLKKK